MVRKPAFVFVLARLVGISCMAVFLAVGTSAPAQGKLVESPDVQTQDETIIFCRPHVSEPLVTGYANFVEIYELTLAADGSVSGVRGLKRHELVADASKCLRGWSLYGSNGGGVAKVMLAWEHGYGWRTMTVHSGKRVIKLQLEGWSQYSGS